MFEGLSAWFSTSVRRKIKQLWVDYGGREASLEDAQFIFSQDAKVPDTESIFNSDAYLEEHLAVFHPSYIRECIKHGNISKVTLGKYFFPPADVQAIAREQLQYQWDIDGNTHPGDSSGSSDDEEPTKRKQTPNKVDRTGHLNTVSVLQRNGESKVRDKHDQPGPSGVSRKAHESDGAYKESDTQKKLGQERNLSGSVHSKGHFEKDVELKRKSLRPSSRNETSKVDSMKRGERNVSEIKSPKRVTSEERKDRNIRSSKKSLQSDTEDTHFSLSAEEKERQNEGVKKKGIEISATRKQYVEKAEILRLEDLAKVTGDLQDFTVGKNGCELVKIL